MHFYGGWRKGVVWWEHEGPPILAIVVGGFGGAGEDIVPSVDAHVRLLDCLWTGIGIERVKAG